MTNKTLILLLLGALGLVILCAVVAVGAALVYLSPQMPAFFTRATPAPACREPRLALGAASFRIETLPRAADGSIQVPEEAPGVAYWVEGTSPRYVFALPPTGANQEFAASVQPGNVATIVWADCESETYTVTGTEIGAPDLPALLDQPASGFTLFVPSAGSPVALVIHAENPILLVTPVAPTGEVEPTETGPQAEIAFGEYGPAPDGQSFRLAITITNIGSQPFTISPGDISLTPEGGQPLAPLSVDPPLPLEVAPGASVDLALAFPMPEGNVALFQILDFAVDLYY